MTAFRPGKLTDIRLNDFTFTTCSDAECIRVSDHTDRCDGSAKIHQVRLKMVRHKPPEIIIWEMNQVFGLVNVFDNLKTYIDIVSTFPKSLDKYFFVQPSMMSPQNISFSKIKTLVNSLLKCVLDARTECCLQGEGVSQKMALHGLRGTVISQLIEAGHGDAAVALCSGHRDRRHFASYHNLRGGLGAKQQEDILRGTSDKEFSSTDNNSTDKVEEIPSFPEANNPSSSVVGGVHAENVTVNINYHLDAKH